MKDSYDRKISAEEAREGFVFLTKDAVRFFPPAGQEFPLEGELGSGAAQVVAVPCQCVGEPHEHFHLRGPSPFVLAKGTKVHIRRLPSGSYEATYTAPAGGGAPARSAGRPG